MEERTVRKWNSSGMSVHALGKSFRLLTAGSRLELPHVEASADEMLKRTHTHFTFEVLFAINGGLTLVTEDGVDSYENTVVIVPPGLKHCTSMQAKGSYCLLVLPQFSPNEAWGVSLSVPVALPLTEEIGFYVQRLSEVWNTDAERAEHLAALLVSAVFGALIQKDSTPVRATQSSASAIGMIESYVNSNYSKGITLGDLSHVVHLCEKQVARIIKREYGVTLAQLLAQKRVGAAEMLLKNSNMKISEIAARVSPTAENYFFTVFKEQTGMSPLQYRKAYQQKE